MGRIMQPLSPSAAVAGCNAGFGQPFPPPETVGSKTPGLLQQGLEAHGQTSLHARTVVYYDNPSASLNSAFPARPECTNTRTRAEIGGKGLFLQIMQQANLPVPPFTFIETSLINTLEQHPVPKSCLLPYLPDLAHLDQEQFSLSELRDMTTGLPRQQQTPWLRGLATFIGSKDFLAQIAGLDSALEIRQRYLACQQQSHCQRCIVRSSGVDEDRFGDAQAGRYQSIVHHDGDILATCLQVLASAYRPDACPQGKVSAMALIIQQYIQCQAGGVLISHSSLSDDSIQVEFVPSQPDDAVSGKSASPVLRCTIRRDTTEDDLSAEEKYRFLRDSSDQNTAMGLDDALLSADTLQRLQDYTEQLESRFCCPVDIEFGIDDRQQLFLLQVRPVTCLPGSNHYTDRAPESSLVVGTIVSEGCCSGVALRACATTPRPAEQLSAGAVLFADYAGDWMLAPDILQRLGGFVFRLGAINGHVAIALRQAGKPCLLAGEQFSPAVDHASGQQVTLLVGSFAGEPGAYLLKGDHSAHWQAARTTLSQDSIGSCPLASTTRPSEPLDYNGVDQALSWLNRQNDKLLGYFHADRLLNRCLAPGRSTAMSMSANRTRLLPQLESEIMALVHDLKLFFGGYQHFLALAQGTDIDTDIDTDFDTDFDLDFDIDPDPKTALTLLNRELPPLGEQYQRLQASVSKLCEKIVMPLATDQELPEQPLNFRQWRQDCQSLQDILQKLTQPEKVHMICSVHDLILWLHKRFVDALAPVAATSGQGQITVIAKHKTLVSILAPGITGLLDNDCLTVLNRLLVSRLQMLNLADAAFIHVELGSHICTITMLEQAEGGKGRTLCLSLSDNFSQLKKHHHVHGKLMRFWFLVQALRYASIDSDSHPTILMFNETAGKITIELTQVNSTQALQNALVKLVTVLDGISSIDIPLNALAGSNNANQWSFDKMIRHCQRGIDESDNNWMFKHCLVLIGIQPFAHLSCVKSDNTFLKYLDDEYKLLFNLASMEEPRRLHHSDTPMELYQLYADKIKHLEPSDAARILEGLFIHLAIATPHYGKQYISVLRSQFNLDHDPELVLFLREKKPELMDFL